MEGEYNPLDYDNLTRNVVDVLMRQGPYTLPPSDFGGAGVYALFYTGPLEFYSSVRSPESDVPIYVGKAEEPGGRKGKTKVITDRPLFKRLREHSASIEAAENLALSDFTCRYLAVTPIWVKMAERLLIEEYTPLWNTCIDGFGNHDPGSGRHKGEITWWDALHPGRTWATRLRQTRTLEQAVWKVKDFLAPPSSK